MSEKGKKIINGIQMWFYVILFCGLGVMSIINIIEIVKLKQELKHQEEIYETILDTFEDYTWETKENELLAREIYWLKQIQELELKNATSNGELKAELNKLKAELNKLKDDLDNYEDYIEVYFNWLKNNPNGTENEFENYLLTNHKWLYDWMIVYTGR